MKYLRPNSILQLTVTGFMAMTVLLVAALVIMQHQLDVLSTRSEEVIRKTAGSMSAGSELIEQTIAMERNARQYLILGDNELLDIYTGRREKFIRSAMNLSALGVHKGVNTGITELLKDEETIFVSLTSTPLNENLISAYPLLLDLAYRILYEVDAWIDQQLIELRMQAERTQRMLILQAIFLLIMALFLAGIFTILITRPLNQIDRAINYLGSGRYDDPIRIHGPRDLQELGMRLDWLRNRLNDLEEQRTFFMRHVSHELKTPLAAIREGTALLNEGVMGPVTSQQNDVINILHKNCRRLQGLIENLLRYNVESLAVLKPMPHPVKLNEVIERVISDHSLTIEACRYQIVCDIEKLTVHGDAEQLRVVVDNLISNALKYSPRMGIIEIILKREHEYAVLEVSDEGPGIPLEERAKVFDPYFKGQPPAEMRHLQGSGLGLAITKEYVEINGGSIEVVDAAHGTCMRVQIPVDQREG